MLLENQSPGIWGSESLCPNSHLSIKNRWKQEIKNFTLPEKTICKISGKFSDFSLYLIVLEYYVFLLSSSFLQIVLRGARVECVEGFVQMDDWVGMKDSAFDFLDDCDCDCVASRLKMIDWRWWQMREPRG